MVRTWSRECSYTYVKIDYKLVGALAPCHLGIFGSAELVGLAQHETDMTASPTMHIPASLERGA